jgi:hypothetical protein
MYRSGGMHGTCLGGGESDTGESVSVRYDRHPLFQVSLDCRPGHTTMITYQLSSDFYITCIGALTKSL